MNNGSCGERFGGRCAVCVEVQASGRAFRDLEDRAADPDTSAVKVGIDQGEGTEKGRR